VVIRTRRTIVTVTCAVEVEAQARAHAITRSRDEARRLLAEGGRPDGFAFVQEVLQSGVYFADLRSGNFEAGLEFQWHRIVPHDARVRGWIITPSHYLNNQLDTVWLAE
jgi:hypothetical protein